jgi:hypothetical protein
VPLVLVSVTTVLCTEERECVRRERAVCGSMMTIVAVRRHRKFDEEIEDVEVKSKSNGFEMIDEMLTDFEIERDGWGSTKMDHTSLPVLVLNRRRPQPIGSTLYDIRFRR